MLLGAMFLRGFREVIGLAVVIVGIYLVLNLIVIGYGVAYLIEHPERWHGMDRAARVGRVVPCRTTRSGPHRGGSGIIAISLLLFPKLALGLSGFETGVAVAAHVRGRPDDDPKEPKGRIAQHAQAASHRRGDHVRLPARVVDRRSAR